MREESRPSEINWPGHEDYHGWISLVSSARVRTKGRRTASAEPASRSAWAKATRRYQRSLVAMQTAMATHAAVEQKMFATRRALETLPFQPAVTVVTETEVHIKDSLQPLVHLKSSRETRLMARGTFCLRGRGRGATRAHVQGVAGVWSATWHSGGAYEPAKAISDAKYALSSAAIDRSEAE